MGHGSEDSRREIDRLSRDSQDANHHARVENISDNRDLGVDGRNDEGRSGNTAATEKSLVVGRNEEGDEHDADHVDDTDSEGDQLCGVAHGVSGALGFSAHDTDEDLVTDSPCSEQSGIGETLETSWLETIASESSRIKEKLTEKPFLKALRSVQVEPSWTFPLGPAPQTRARERKMIMRKSKILTSEVTYSNQANTVLGRRKMRNVKTIKTVSGRLRGQLLGQDSFVINKALTNRGGWHGAFSPEVDKNITEDCLSSNNSRPSCARVGG